MAKASLIEVGEAGLRLQELLYEAEGELTPELESHMDDILKSGKEALDSGAAVLRRMDGEAEYLKAEAKRLTERAKSIEANREHLRARMGFAIDGAFGGKVKTEKNTLWMQSSPDTLAVELAADADLMKLNVNYSELVKKTYALDATAVKNRYQAGDVIPSAIVVTPQSGKRSLRMR